MREEDQTKPEPLRTGELVECVDDMDSSHALSEGSQYVVDAGPAWAAGLVCVSRAKDGHTVEGLWDAGRFKRLKQGAPVPCRHPAKIPGFMRRPRG